MRLIFHFNVTVWSISGSIHHSEDAIFKEYSTEHFWTLVGFTNPYETWFGGNLIAAHWLFRLKETLLIWKRNPELAKKITHQDVVLALKKECDWDYVFVICNAFHPIMWLIWLAYAPLEILCLASQLYDDGVWGTDWVNIFQHPPECQENHGVHI